MKHLNKILANLSVLKSALIVIALIGLGACQFGGDSDLAMANKKQTSQTEKENIPYMKPGAGVYIVEPLSIEMNVGETKVVAVRMRSVHKQGLLKVDISSDKSIETEVAHDSRKMFELERSPEVELDVQITAKAEGKHYVHIFAAVDSRSGVQSRALVLPVYVGSDEKISGLKKKSTGSSPKATELKAEETITNL